MKLLCYQQRSVFGPWLICWTATWWCLLSLASTACASLRDSLPGRMIQPWQRWRWDGRTGGGVKWGQGCWECTQGADVFGTPLCFIYFLIFPLVFPAFLSTPNSYCSLMFSSGPLNSFSWSVQYLFVGCANTGKVQAPFLYIRGRVGFLGGGGGCVLCLAHSGTYSLGNEFGSGEAC